jgi:hypothetical protein
MATNKKTVSVYADDDLLAALEKFKDDEKHKSLNVAIVAILREKLFGEVSDNLQSTLQSKASSTLDIKGMIETAINSRLIIIESEVSGLKTDRHIEKTDGLLIEKLHTDLAIAHHRIDSLDKKIAALTSEAKAPAKKPLQAA